MVTRPRVPMVTETHPIGAQHLQARDPPLTHAWHLTRLLIRYHARVRAPIGGLACTGRPCPDPGTFPCAGLLCRCSALRENHYLTSNCYTHIPIVHIWWGLCEQIKKGTDEFESTTFKNNEEVTDLRKIRRDQIPCTCYYNPRGYIIVTNEGGSSPINTTRAAGRELHQPEF